MSYLFVRYLFFLSLADTFSLFFLSLLSLLSHSLQASLVAPAFVIFLEKELRESVFLQDQQYFSVGSAKITS
jgi:hypothetical protein